MVTDLKIFGISDNHIGNNLVPARKMRKDTLNYLQDNIDIISKCNIFTLTGDFPDRLMYTNSEEYGEAVSLLLAIGTLCDKNNITLLYVDGTPSHEMNQMGNLSKILRKAIPTLKYYYFDKMDIVHLSEFDMNLMVIPAHSATNDDALYTKAKKLLRSKDLTKVDFMLTHTEYEEAVSYPTNGVKSTALWSNMVRYYILNGHIHYHSIRDKVISVGAMDFTAHGDDETKGGIYIEIIGEVPKVKFIPTKHYTRFKTIDVVENTGSQLLEIINRNVQSLNAYGELYHLRVLSSSISKEFAENLKKENPLMVLKVEGKRIRDKQETKKVVESKDLKTFEITEVNIKGLVLDRIGSVVCSKLAEEELEKILKEP